MMEAAVKPPFLCRKIGGKLAIIDLERYFCRK
jgi:hypothetical protein